MPCKRTLFRKRYQVLCLVVSPNSSMYLLYTVYFGVEAVPVLHLWGERMDCSGPQTLNRKLQTRIVKPYKGPEF